MILPGVPLVPNQPTAEQGVRNGDPLADPEREIAAREARAAQPLPVRIVASQAPASAPVPTPTQAAAPASTPVPAPEAVAPLSSDENVPLPRMHEAPTPDSTVPSAPEPRPATRPTSHTPARATSTVPTPVPTPAPGTNPAPNSAAPSRLASGPWPDPTSAAWPTTIPSWGRPPKGFACPTPRVAMVLKDGSQVAPEPDDARAMLGLAASLGA